MPTADVLVIGQVENEKAANRKRLQDLENDILTKPRSVIDGYNKWMSRADIAEPYSICVNKKVFRQTDEFYFVLNATDIIELLTYTELELGILTLFEIRHYVLLIICPKDGRGFILNPQKDSQTNENCYRLARLVDSVVGSLKWDFPLVNRQPKD
nr:ulp1 protease family, C-terminal catalytic domain-containing protein [Tanacetum cinerariifolium]